MSKTVRKRVVLVVALCLFAVATAAQAGGGRGAGGPASTDLTIPPIATKTSPLPAIHGPRITGSTPGRPFLFLIPATGEEPLTFSAKNLPAGLVLDGKTGIISGALKEAGTTDVEVTLRNVTGEDTRKLTIVGGERKLALTPPLGWNSWNCWGTAVDDAKIRAAADSMVKSGLAAHGFQYINIDDAWEAKRDEKGEIQSNNKFPDMKALADYVHGKGLKLGIYSSPGPTTCARYEGSYQHEQQDADTYAKWGIDYLKYDWCSYDQVARGASGGAAAAPGGGRGQITLEIRQKPYILMRECLDKCGRDIVYSLCQYGAGNVWEWGEKVGGNCWRTTGDINDSWGSMSQIGFGGNGREKFAGPGHWNDPDMLVVGRVGWGPNLHPSRLTPNEQLTHISLWCLQSSPLLIGCDMTAMDEFTLSLLTNDDVLDVNQDPLGKPAGRIATEDQTEVWARPLYDGTMAVGLFNRGIGAAKVKINWTDLKLSGDQPVRDLWQKKNLGDFKDSFETSVPEHGAVLVKVGKPK
jgi:alpha-galactosidase